MSTSGESDSSCTSSDNTSPQPPMKERKKWMTGKPIPRSTAQRWLAQMSDDDDGEDVNDDGDEDNLVEQNEQANEPEQNLGQEDDYYFSHGEDSDSDSSSTSNTSSSTSASTDSSSDTFTTRSTTSETVTAEPMSESLYPGSKMTKGQAVSKLLDLCCRHAASKSLIIDLVQYTFEILPKPNTFPQTFYYFEQDINPYVPPELSVVHYCCEDCGVYLGTGDNVNTNCGVCKVTAMKSFYEFPLATQIKYLFEERNLADAIDSYATKVGDISDRTKGEEYQKVKSHLRGKYDVVLLSSTDGLRPHKNSEEEIWALTYTICEVPPPLRSRVKFHCHFPIPLPIAIAHCYSPLPSPPLPLPFQYDALRIASAHPVWRLSK